MKIYLIKKFQTNTCGMYTWEPWKITNNYHLILREIKKDVIDEREVLLIEYKNESKYLMTVNKVIPNHKSFGYGSDGSIIEMAPCNWPLFTYVVSEMEVITE